jgi:hypothetical protein
VIPANERVSLELFVRENDGNRAPLIPKFVFKTPMDSDAGVLLRWKGYVAQEGIKLGLWVLELVDPKTQQVFHRITGNFRQSVQMNAIDGLKDRVPKIIEQGGKWSFLRLLNASAATPSGEPIKTGGKFRHCPMDSRKPSRRPRRFSNAELIGDYEGLEAHIVNHGDRRDSQRMRQKTQSTSKLETPTRFAGNTFLRDLDALRG